MKAILPVAILASLGFALSARAQVDFIIVEKMNDNIQTNTGTVTLRPFIPNDPNTLPPLSSPYRLQFHVEGETNLSTLTPMSFTVPSGSSFIANPSADYNLYYNSESNNWGRTFQFQNKYSPTGGPPSGTGPGGLDGVFNNGAFSINVGGTTVNVNLGGVANADVYPSTPVASVSAGTWAVTNPILYLDVNEALTITTSTFANYTTNGYLNHIGLYIFMKDGDELAELESFSDNTNFPGKSTDDFLSYTINSGTLISGKTYVVEMEFNTATSQSSEYSGAFGAALFTSRTHFAIQAVPEPSTYAAIIGLVSLAGAAAMRRRSAGSLPRK